MRQILYKFEHWIRKHTFLRRTAKLVYWTITLQLFRKIRERLKPTYLYQIWINENEPSNDDLGKMRLEQDNWQYQPKISLITPVFRPQLSEITDCIESVLDQIYDNWEFCITLSADEDSEITQILESLAARDSRVKISKIPENKGIAGNSNESIRIASGEFIGLLDQDDVLAPFALHEVVKVLNGDRTLDFVYSDEDKFDERGRGRAHPHFKPEWSPDTFLSHNYICHISVIRKSLVDAVGGFRDGYEGSQDYDLFLRITERTQKIHRIPKVLYHWRASPTSAASHAAAKPYAHESGKKALESHLQRCKIDAEVHAANQMFTYRVKYRVHGSPTVSIIIPTLDKADILRTCISSILDLTDYEHYEILIVDNGSEKPETLDLYESYENVERVRVLEYGRQPFNYSKINNYAVEQSSSEHLLFLNNDTEVINSEWLSAMLEFSQRANVGAVGARLLYPDGSIQHAGVVIGLLGVAGHAFKGLSQSRNGFGGKVTLIQNVSAVTGACMMVKRYLFDKVNGFDDRLAESFNDIDFCLKLRERDLLNIYTPHAELIHHESATRGLPSSPERKEQFKREIEFMKAKWDLQKTDPYYNPNLTLDREDFSIRIAR